MTQPHEVTVTDAEEIEFVRCRTERGTKYALAAFLAKRVLKAKPRLEPGVNRRADVAAFEAHNALRDAVLKGPQK